MKKLIFIPLVLFFMLFCCTSHNKKLQYNHTDNSTPLITDSFVYRTLQYNQMQHNQEDNNVPYLTSSFDNETGFRIIELKCGEVILDTIQTNDEYYGGSMDSIFKIDSLLYICIYDVRAGSGVSVKNQKLIHIKGNKLHCLYSDLFLCTGMIPVYDGNTPVKDSNGDYVYTVEYDSIQIFRKNNVWYSREKTFQDNKYSEKIRRLHINNIK